jgi:long-chain acyl-CoA synthetase
MSVHPWIKSYPPGVRWDAQFPVGPVQQVLDDAAATWPDHHALDFMGRRITYRELHGLVRRAAKGLQKLGVKPGVHVGLYLPNTPHYAISFFAVLNAGGTVVNYSPLDSEKLLQHKIDDSETDVLITLDLQVLYPQMHRMLGATRLQKLVVGSMSEMAAQPEAIHAQMAEAGLVSAVFHDARTLSFAALLDNDGACERYPIGDPNDSLAVLQYTGGTTGQPKGAMLTHANLRTACGQIWETFNGETPVLQLGCERILSVLPPFHIYALMFNTIFCTRIGAELVQHTRFDPEAVIRDIEAKKVTVFPGVPTMHIAMINHPSIAQHDLGSLKYCGTGGAPTPPKLNEQFKAITGCALNEGWGMTETSPTGTFTPVVGTRHPGSCGMPMPGITIRLLNVDDASNYVALGQRGEICVSGANVMKAYWKNPEATAAAMTPDGMLRTGDVGIMDADGYITIVDRIKDMILCSGYNVYPRTLEDAIYQHPAVSEVSVIGVHDAYRGQSPKAFIKLKDGMPALTLHDLQEFLHDKVGRHEMVRAIEIRSELPKTAVGKLSKKELYDEERAAHAGAQHGSAAA